MLKLIRIFALLILLSTSAYADGKEAENSNKVSSDTVPGQEVITPTGKKVKFWSTKGPVEVSKAPDPFSDPEKAKLPVDPHIIIDENSIRKNQVNKQPESDN